MRKYIRVGADRIELQNKKPFQVFVNGEYIIGVDDEKEGLRAALIASKVLRAVGIDYDIPGRMLDNIIDGKIEIHNFKTQDQ